MDAAEMFLIHHQRMHAHVDRLSEGLSEEQIRACAHPLVNPLAWLLWHIARGEDSALNLLVCDGPQVLDDDWVTRLNAGRRDVGTGMTMAEVIDLSARVHLPALTAYWQAVGERTAERVASLRPLDLDQVVSSERIGRFVTLTVQGPAQARLEQLWQGSTTGHFLIWLVLAHNSEHIGQADLIRGILGQPGRF